MRFGPSVAALLVVVACDLRDTTTPIADCEDPSAINAEEAMDLYLAAWSEEDPSERACLVQRSLAADAVLIATAAPIEGHSAIVQDLDDRITLLFGEAKSRDSAGAIQSRHQEARLPWVVTDRSGAVIEHGEDWLEFDEDGLLSRIHVFAEAGADAPLSDPLLAWQRAWNTRDEASRADALNEAATADVRFTDLVTDIRGRDPLGVEIGRQQDALDGELHLDDRVEVFASVDGEPFVIRVPARIVVPPDTTIRIIDYIRLRDGRIERLSGFPSPAR